ncbi:MAG TPA: DNA cytosine methyltransferase, partial [Niabella sp.]|nr:DNA cytosine methyltransferase [Niabella sp.]
GLDLGLEESGFHTAVCVEYDADCRETLRYNRAEWKLFEDGVKFEKGKMKTRIPGDIRDISVDELLKFSGLKRGQAALVVGGAPCQPFSNIGKKLGKNDEKNGDLFLEFVRMVKGVSPEAFIFENVVGITQEKHADVIKYMVDKFKGLGYGISYTVLNSANYGVPQRRERFFLIGIKGVQNPAFPFPTHFKDEKHFDSFIKDFKIFPIRKFKKWVSVKDAFKKMPKKQENRIDYALMNISDKVVERMTYIKQGENFKVLPMKLRPDCWKNGSHQGNDTFGRIIADLPSYTIRTAAYNPAKGQYIHPFENRGLSTVEMATLQSFPFNWYFRCKGNDRVTLVSGGRQIGNAVPPLLAQVLGAAIKKQIWAKKTKSVKKQPELVEVN